MSSVSTSVPRCCLNIKSKRYKDIRCKSAATNGDFCSRHYKNPTRYNKTLKDMTIFLDTYSVNANANAKKIQLWVRRRFAQFASIRQGPAANYLEISNNTTELNSIEPLTTIPKLYLWSYADSKKHVWCFDIRVFSHMASSGLKNPYTQLPLEDYALIRLEARINWLKKKGYSTVFMNDTELTAEQQFNLRVLDVFMKMDFLGYHSNTDWFADLSLENHIKLYKELYDLWMFRLGLNQESKAAICPELNELMRYDPFRLKIQREIRWWKKLNLDIFDALLSRAPEKTNRALGAMYCLTALTYVCKDAKEAYNWLD